MSELGNVFDAVAPEAGPRGPDLRVAVQVPRSVLGRGSGYAVSVDDRLEHEGALVPRAVHPDDPPGKVRLHLSEGLPRQARLRLRGRGGVVADGSPGDLFVDVTVVDDTPVPARGGHAWWVALLMFAAVAAWLLASS
jgi:hypothetical protein